MPILRHRYQWHLIQRWRIGELMAFATRTQWQVDGPHEDAGKDPAPCRFPADASAVRLGHHAHGTRRFDFDDITPYGDFAYLTKPPFAFAKALHALCEQMGRVPETWLGTPPHHALMAGCWFTDSPIDLVVPTR